MQDTEYDPVRGERLILNLRVENRQLKSRLRSIERLSDQELPPSWAKKLRKLRDENVQLRRERNALRAELEARGDCDVCHCQIAADAEDIDKGVCPRSGNPLGGCHRAQGCGICDSHR